MLTFERGEQAQPKGHALLYFKDADDVTKLVATYLVVLPVAVDIVKYMPPFLASQARDLSSKGVSAFAFPPVPETSETYERLLQLAEARSDDLLFGGTVNLGQVPYLLTVVNDIVQEYGESFHRYLSSLPTSSRVKAHDDLPTLNVDDIMLEFMSDRERLAEIAKSIGTLRFALDGRDRHQAQDSIKRMEQLARHLSNRYRPTELVTAAKDPSAMGATLVRLFVERCYKLLDDDHNAVRDLDERIRVLQSSRQ